MTKFEKEQENYKTYESFADTSLKVIKTKSYKIKVRDNKDWEDYVVEFSVDNVYSLLGDMLVFDIKIDKVVPQYSNAMDGKKFKSDTNTFRRVTNSLKEEFPRRFKDDVLVKTALWGIKGVHINNVIV